MLTVTCDFCGKIKPEGRDVPIVTPGQWQLKDACKECADRLRDERKKEAVNDSP